MRKIRSFFFIEYRNVGSSNQLVPFEVNFISDTRGVTAQSVHPKK